MIVKQLPGQFMDANVFVIIDDGEALIVDSGANVELVKAAVGDAQVKGVLITHGHFDHTLNCKQYAKTFASPIYMSIFGKETVISPEKNYGLGEGKNPDFFIDNFDEFEFLKGDGKLNLGHFVVEYFSTPGHSPCGICFKIGGDLFSGDTLFSNGIGRIDLIGSNKKDMLASLNKLQGVEFETLHSGHGEDSSMARQKRNIEVYKRFLSR